MKAGNANYSDAGDPCSLPSPVSQHRHLRLGRIKPTYAPRLHGAFLLGSFFGGVLEGAGMLPEWLAKFIYMTSSLLTISVFLLFFILVAAPLGQGQEEDVPLEATE